MNNGLSAVGDQSSHLMGASSATSSLEEHLSPLVVIAASAGGIPALWEILQSIPENFPGTFAIVLHRTPKPPYLLDQVLQPKSKLPVLWVKGGETIRPGIVYLAPPDRHLLVSSDRTFSLIDGYRIRGVLSSANPLFESAAEVFKENVIGVVLTGGDADGTDGVQNIRHHGGTVIAQDFATSEQFSMPRSAISTGAVDYILPLDKIAPKLMQLAGYAD